MNTVHTLTNSTELFIDDALIASKQGVKHTLHPCVKHDVPVLEPDPDNPWVRAGRVARNLNYMRFMGGVVASSIPDDARIFVAGVM